jgi:hypothetical protein
VEETELRRQAERLGVAGERQERQAAALWVAREVGGEVVQETAVCEMVSTQPVWDL